MIAWITPNFFSVVFLSLGEGGGGREDSVLTLGNTGLLHAKATFSCKFEKETMSNKHIIGNKCSVKRIFFIYIIHTHCIFYIYEVVSKYFEISC